MQRGCDKFCTYCVVPGVRGREKCRRPEHVLADVRKLAKAGCREVTLLGQTVNSYTSVDATGRKIGLAQLLESVCEVASLARVRFVTNYPGGFDEEILRAIGRDRPGSAICPYLHIPAQSGSDRMLRAMRRQYTADDYYRLIDRARELAPGISLAGDFIVGFPGETDADFAATVAMVRRVSYKNCFVFKYSPRPGTAAFHLVDDVPDQVKRDRNNQLLAVQAEISAKANAEMVGQTASVLIEGLSKMEVGGRGSGVGSQGSGVGEQGSGGSERETAGLPPSPSGEGRAALGEGPAKPEAGGKGTHVGRPPQLTGRTVADQIVVFPCPAGVEPGQLVGRLADVRIEQVTPYTLIGDLASVEGATLPASAVPLRYKSLTVLP